VDDTDRGKNFDGLIKSIYDVELNLQNVQADPNSPLYSASSFEELGLSEGLKKGVYSMGFNKPSKIQEKALPILIKNDENGKPRNLIGQSQSGTGKTAAFSLSMLSRVRSDLKKPQAICIAPTRELARQIGEVITQKAKFTDIRVCFAVREDQYPTSVTEQVVVGTPGTVANMVQKGIIPTDSIVIFVVDEADAILASQGLGDQALRVKKKLPSNCQIALFSATFEGDLRKFATTIAPNANLLSLKRQDLTVDSIEQFYIRVHSRNDKFSLLSRLYGLMSVASSIIFCATINTADQLHSLMKKEGYTVSVLHGSLEKKDRDQIIDDFRVGKIKVLISTNVLARGIDILQISLVINYDLPMTHNTYEADYETYLHRIGRTGRFGRKGSAINIVHDDQSFRILQQIETFFNKKITELPSDDESLEALLKKVSEHS